jgi:poly(3-hydroxybutyrate) depolymerase
MWSTRRQTERVRPQDIRGTALLTVEGELDDISGSGQTRAAHDLCTASLPTSASTWKCKAPATTASSAAAAGAKRLPALRDFMLQHQAGTPTTKIALAAGPARTKAESRNPQR